MFTIFMIIVFAFLFTSALAVSVMAMDYMSKCDEKIEEGMKPRKQFI